MEKYKYINFLKGIAIFGVILVHSPQKIVGLDSLIKELLHFGAFGCQLFFVISGYLSVLSWNRIIGQSKNRSDVIFKFYRRRFLSIGPIYFLFIIFYQILAYLISYFKLPEFYPISTDSLSVIANFLLLQGLDFENFNTVVPGGWFIGTIVLFYIIFPLLYKCHLKLCLYNNKFSPLFLTVIVTAISFIIQYTLMLITDNWILSRTGSYVYYSLLNQIPCLTLGIAIHNLSFKNADWRKYVVLSLGLFFVTNLAYYILRFHYWIYCFIPLMLGLTFLFFFIGLRNAYKTTFLGKTYIARWLEKAGALSFSAYFTNFIGAFIFPWGIQLILYRIGITIHPCWLFTILFVPIFVITFITVPPVDYLIRMFKKII